MRRRLAKKVSLNRRTYRVAGQVAIGKPYPRRVNERAERATAKRGAERVLRWRNS